MVTETLTRNPKNIELFDVYFVAASFGEVHHGPAIYTANLWNFFRDSSEFRFHLVVLQSNLQHSQIHAHSDNTMRRRGFYSRLEQHILRTVPLAPRTILHVNSAHLISPRIASMYRTIVQVNDTEVCQSSPSLETFRRAGLRRTLALAWRKRRELAVVRTADKTICNSRFTLEEVKQRYGVGDDRASMIYKGVELQPFLDVNPLSAPSTPSRLAFVGSNWQRKGLATLIHAVRLVVSQRPDSKFRVGVYGHPDKRMERQANRLVRELGVERYFEFCGTVSRHELPAILAGSRCLVLPSLEEALGLSAIEALATGIPVIGSRIGGIPEVVQCSRLGTLCESGNPEELAQAISLALDSVNTQADVEFRKLSSQRFSAHNLKKQIAKLYQELARGF